MLELRSSEKERGSSRPKPVLEQNMGNGRLTICQISDIHCGNARFIPELLDRTIIEINRAHPAIVVISGDLTDAGYREEFEQAAEYIARIECESIMVIPGNHDSRNVGYVHFERLFGERQSIIDLEEVILVGVDSSEPDLNDMSSVTGCPGASGNSAYLQAFRLFRGTLFPPRTDLY
jgi:hypothetical protein